MNMVGLDDPRSADPSRRWLLLHGTPLGPAVWAETQTALGHDPVSTPDCTAVPAGPDPQRALAERVAASVSGDLDVVGHSFGGQIALELALAVPDRVRSLTILCSRDTPFPPFAAAGVAIAAGTAPDADGTLGRWFSAAELASGAAVVDVARQDVVSASLPDWARALAAIAVYDSSERVAELAMPVTLVAAGQDGVSTPTAVKAMAGRIPGAVMSVHDAWHHMSPFVTPGALAKLLITARGREPA